MFTAINTGSVLGMEAYPVRVEVDLSKGLPGFELVGSVGNEGREARERVQIALKNAGYSLPVARITVNLSPARIRKEGTGYDLPIAAGLLSCMGIGNPDTLSQTAFLGELALNGEVRPVNGTLPIALALKKAGIKQLLLAKENAGECAVFTDLIPIAISSLKDMIRFLQADEEERRQEFKRYRPPVKRAAVKREEPDFVDVYGQEGAKRAALIAAAGIHHLLFTGPPGTGKTMVAKRIPGILPPLEKEEQMEVASIYSIAGKWNAKGLPDRRPFLAPHHTLSPQALAGGGKIPRPGLLSLAHRGVLFLDETPEFSTAALEVLRQPLEDKKVQIARSHGTYTYPAEFLLVCAMNPCPCGYFPDRNRCSCTEPDIKRYLNRISGPLLDRIDIMAEVGEVGLKELHKEQSGDNSSQLRAWVLSARERQEYRYRTVPYRCNGELTGRDVERYCRLNSEGQHFLEQVYESGQMSMRAYHKVLKLARTIADLEETEDISVGHLSEAVCYNNGKQRFYGV